MNALGNLQNEEIQTKGFVISTAEALKAFLKYRPEVILLRKAIEAGEVTPTDIKEYVDALLRSFSRGKKFAHEIDLAAISMALETFPGTFAKAYLEDLSRVQIRELALAPRVARLCLARRQKVVSGVTVRTKVISIQRYDHSQCFKEAQTFRIGADNEEYTERLAS